MTLTETGERMGDVQSEKTLDSGMWGTDSEMSKGCLYPVEYAWSQQKGGFRRTISRVSLTTERKHKIGYQTHFLTAYYVRCTS